MKDFKLYISIAGIILLVYLVAEYNKPSPVNWSPTFYYKDKIPFGTFILYNQLNQLFPGARVVKTNASVYKTLGDTNLMPGSYLIVTRAVKITKYDFSELVKYIKAGNSVFISCYSFSGFLADTLKLSVDDENSKNARLNFTNARLKRSADYVFNNNISNHYFSTFDIAKATLLSKNNLGHATYLKFEFGRGNLYLCANPGVFTNVGLLSGDGADYAAKALAYLPVTNRIYWDEFQNGDIPADDSPLRVFFGNPALQWAYYLSLAGIIIFILFEMKRRQRVIPVIAPLTNSTLEFVTVVGQVYYEKRNNMNIAHKKILYLMEHLRDHYQLKTNKLDDEFIEKLSAKCGVTSSFAIELVNYIKYIGNQDRVNDRELIELNKLIEQFYIQSR